MRSLPLLVTSAVLFLCPSWAQQTKTPPPAKTPPAKPAPKVHPDRLPGGNVPKARPTVDEQLEKLSKMTPAEREKALSILPEARRQRLQDRLTKLDSLPPEERERRQIQLERFNKLPLDQQQRVRELAKKVQALPDDRRPVVRRELTILRNLPEDQREKRISDPSFQKRFSPEEQEILRDSPSLVPQHF